MKTVETENEGLKRAYTLTIPAKDIDARVDGEIKRLAPTVRMPGFRPGKVPPNLIRKMHGEALMRDALNTAVQDSVQQLLADKKIRPAMQPEVELDESYETGKDAEIKVRLETLPDVPKPKIDGLKLERLTRRRSMSSSSSLLRRRPASRMPRRATRRPRATRL
jgi:trigger factor